MKKFYISVKLKYIRILNMQLLAGFQFLIFLIFFGYVNYLMMQNRYENDMKKKRKSQLKKISQLYPKGTFIKI